ncbi:MAG: hypothetical protein ACRDIL_02640 [Candidatus Limnocylindrales bacterium]
MRGPAVSSPLRLVRVGRGVLLAGAVLVAGGCQYLLGLPTDPDFTMPTPEAVYGEGRATVKIGSDPAITLDELARPGTFDPMIGGEVTFRGVDGWSVQVLGAQVGGGFMLQPGWIQLDRIVDGQHWTIADPTRCVLTIVAADPFALRGSATCKGLRWSDALGGGAYMPEPAYIADQPAFDAEITFEAAPKSLQIG